MLVVQAMWNSPHSWEGNEVSFVNFSFRQQVLQSINPRFLDGREINGRMRAILVDWLVQVHSKFRLLQETLYMCVAIMDRFLQVSVASGTVAVHTGIALCNTKGWYLEEKTQSHFVRNRGTSCARRESSQVCQTSGDADHCWAFVSGQPAEKCWGPQGGRRCIASHSSEKT